MAMLSSMFSGIPVAMQSSLKMMTHKFRSIGARLNEIVTLLPNNDDIFKGSSRSSLQFESILSGW